VQCVIAATNIALAVLLTRHVSPAGTAPGLVIAYGGSYALGAVCSYLLLRHVLGGLETPQLVRFLVRLLLAAGVAFLVGWAVRYGFAQVWPDDSKLRAVVVMSAVAGSGGVVYLLLARALRIDEVTGVARLVSSRLGR
jgi:putative peptidoglycan lipid II flippase